MNSPDTKYYAGIQYPSPNAWVNLTNPNTEPLKEAINAYQKYLSSVFQKRSINEMNRFRWSKVVSFMGKRSLWLAAAGVSLYAGYSTLERVMPSVDLPTAFDMIAQRNGQGALFLPFLASVGLVYFCTHMAFRSNDKFHSKSNYLR